MNILAIESSCDETSAAVITNGKICSNVVATQLIHTQYGGVVPELASRAHQQHILPVVNNALNDAKVTKKDLDAIAFTKGPGLLGALLVGTSFAKSMALGLNIPLIEINHMQAHVLAHFIDDPKPEFPFLCLTVSGGHTQIVKVTGPLEMEIIGETKDDAVGEAFDKTAKLLDLPYPGGPLIDKYAALGNPNAYPFPLPEMPGLDFSFSGIKTSFMYFLQKQVRENPNFISENINDICASVQFTLVDILLKKLKKASRETGIREITIAGGVSANSGLRKSLLQLGEKLGWKVYIPSFEYCTDNAAMIAMAAHYKFEANDFTDQTVSPMARMEF
ncbi:tRNA (adenosine(37)-N6)-threonylcarbamoyltransferase complex transferase subunit TsaD [Dyadobacter fanqingshengii]|uniref:tRNA N6-adenosine threonylcarbamoyltransferase n=1 Tax=Dyadobacter fanqingshengii TaxID=2906443 RepID=A0A9X1TIQ1_9BACT|nr:tRNA (adenosine(37)-N6)-threonylcarbamoyltransferase complex transferase subunit TsaD [Dyadobacter fanqingshengii]MCF0043087.1 tRNA (adenosine(37)-N6)-threonylcarbamoyltransferase complex transferase subunit TsaD [Dyadobacter fanqingshengii]USJ35640.1 tRNA (adenosine(37)-N6)-threonylcarbamoyltransferase complex transferase subunit TsaD [Dyadobacter fanqingshengii]